MVKPKKIQLHRQSRSLELHYAEGSYVLPAEYLRVYSPSAEVKGHGPGQEVLQRNKHDVAIDAVAPQGNYALRISFNDGHDSGLFTWSYLHELGRDHQSKWQDYLTRVAAAELAEADQDLSAVKWMEPPTPQ